MGTFLGGPQNLRSCREILRETRRKLVGLLLLRRKSYLFPEEGRPFVSFFF